MSDLSSSSEQESLRALLQRIIRVGTVSARFPKEGAVQVDFRDLETPSWRCPVLVPKTSADKYYVMPDIGERVLVLSLPYGKERGLVVGAFYNDDDQVPAEANESNDRTVIKFDDGTYVVYDRDQSLLDAKAVGDVTVQVQGNVTVTTDKKATVEAEEDVLVKGASGVTIDGGGTIGKALVYPKAISQFTGNPVQPPSATVEESQ